MTLQAHPVADLFPLLGEDELAELAADIRANGLHEPITLDVERRILDGRNRYRACLIADVEPRTTVYRGDDPIGFAVSMNLRRRHLSVGQKAMLALRLEPMYAAEASARVGGRPRGDEPKPRADPREVKARRSDERAAKAVGTKGRNVAAAKRVSEKAPDLAAKVEADELALDRADRIIRDREAEERRVKQAQQDAANLPERPRVDIRHGDFREVLADLTDVDAVITDPPYPREYLPLLGDLAAWADKVLAPDGVLAVLFGQTYLPEVYRLLDGHRPYRWTMAYLTPGPGYASRPAKVQSNWKPVLVYGGGPRFADVLRSEGTDAGAKDLHHWGQDYGAFHTLIERLTRTGQTVADPFVGSGTTLLAAHALGRHAVGADIDERHVATARERLA